MGARSAQWLREGERVPYDRRTGQKRKDARGAAMAAPLEISACEKSRPHATRYCGGGTKRM